MKINVHENSKSEKQHITFAGIAIGEMFRYNDGTDYDNGFYIRIEAVDAGCMIFNAVRLEDGIAMTFHDDEYVSRYTGSIDINKKDVS